VKIPEKGQCFRFVDEKNDFCQLPVDCSSQGNCIFHFRGNTNLPMVNSLKDYYFSDRNICSMTKKNLDSILDSYWMITFYPDKKETACKILDLPDKFTKEQLVNNFRRKIKNTTGNIQQREIIESYKLLKGLFI